MTKKSELSESELLHAEMIKLIESIEPDLDVLIKELEEKETKSQNKEKSSHRG